MTACSLLSKFAYDRTNKTRHVRQTASRYQNVAKPLSPMPPAVLQVRSSATPHTCPRRIKCVRAASSAAACYVSPYVEAACQRLSLDQTEYDPHLRLGTNQSWLLLQEPGAAAGAATVA